MKPPLLKAGQGRRASETFRDGQEFIVVLLGLCLALIVLAVLL